ncbi:hypothetical protein JOC86_004689 [Bacillus pakistanensis]|uniref:Uncharacterized protein n=1 Tax=Rossellomorea pakistanensis TaxID=992288 RepID=A0ABS2NJT5_9BACI|nr:hypothetical protein [Bacillus pakistanensis]
MSNEIIELSQSITSTSTDSPTSEKISTLEEKKRQLINRTEELQTLNAKVEILLKKISNNQSNNPGYKEVMKYVEEGRAFINSKVTASQQSVDLKKINDVILSLQKALEKAEKQKGIEEAKPNEKDFSSSISTNQEKQPKSTEIPKAPEVLEKTTESKAEILDKPAAEPKDVDESNDTEAIKEEATTNKVRESK